MPDESPMKIAPLEWEAALTLYRRMQIYLPEDNYPAVPTIPGATPFAGMAGTPETIDEDFETKVGGPWAVWLVSAQKYLYVAYRSGAPVDQLLYYIGRRHNCILRLHSSWGEMIAAAATAGFTPVGQLKQYLFWQRIGASDLPLFPS